MEPAPNSAPITLRRRITLKLYLLRTPDFRCTGATPARTYQLCHISRYCGHLVSALPGKDEHRFYVDNGLQVIFSSQKNTRDQQAEIACLENPRRQHGQSTRPATKGKLYHRTTNELIWIGREKREV